ncbi:MAG: orotidine-5'-phosphate decarboxylase [Oscillospiraceae bacterium]|jgi:orotidine-5'-phosphate decarboxylase|nr:orotidine-5'-phosphate decarboxylase [Oscillospiraceae bacterium]
MNRGVIIACDFATKTECFQFLEQFRGLKPFLKIGMELFYNEGPSILEEVKKTGSRIFLDLKLHDIPNTIKKTTKNIAELGVDMLTLHASGGSEMMLAAKEGLETANSSTLLIAVTILTSLSAATIRQELLIHSGLNSVVLHYSQNAKKCKMDGIVCSPFEIQKIKQNCGSDFIVVAPGIRVEDNVNDHARMSTPDFAKHAGSDFIVVGRPITTALDPVAAYNHISNEFGGVKT